MISILATRVTSAKNNARVADADANTKPNKTEKEAIFTAIAAQMSMKPFSIVLIVIAYFLITNKSND